MPSCLPPSATSRRHTVPPPAPRSRRTPTLAWAAVGGGCWWLVGAFLGWSRGQDARPSRAGAWIERLVAVGFVVAGVLTLRLIPSAAIAHGSDTNLGYDVNVLR
jgi:hypothetical protein